ncbi:MAG: MBL fold metallo-hydrolase [Saprospiraceae bacterium]|nr:MBL fold metallo-hydrolase [Saprospiraceae bacterium]
MDIAIFTFNPFQENTYILYDDTNDCVIFDPGCSNQDEEKQLIDFINANGLNPVKLVNTHCHIDHVLGNKFVSDTYQLPLISHKGEAQVLAMQPQISSMYGMPYNPSPEITEFLEDGDQLVFGNTTLHVLFTPGHSPASISFYNKEKGVVIAGDVLFKESIGRTDLPGGDFDTLAKSIREKLYVLPDEVVVFPGHGPSTTIGEEKRTNQYVRL